MGYKIKQTVFPSGTGLWEAIAAGELDFACESWPSYAEADDVMFNEDLIYDGKVVKSYKGCLLYTSPSPRDLSTSRMPSSA